MLTWKKDIRLDGLSIFAKDFEDLLFLGLVIGIPFDFMLFCQCVFENSDEYIPALWVKERANCFGQLLGWIFAQREGVAFELIYQRLRLWYCLTLSEKRSTAKTTSIKYPKLPTKPWRTIKIIIPLFFAVIPPTYPKHSQVIVLRKRQHSRRSTKTENTLYIGYMPLTQTWKRIVHFYLFGYFYILINRISKVDNKWIRLIIWKCRDYSVYIWFVDY